MRESSGATVEAPIELITSIADLQFPQKIDTHLQTLMDRNTEGRLSESDRVELEALVELSETVSLLRAQALRALDRPVS